MPIPVAKSFETYLENYKKSIENPEAFWAEEGKRLTWIKSYSEGKAKNTRFHASNPHIRWYEGGILNVSENCLDRHLKERGDQMAILWEGDTPGEERSLTYRDLHREVCKFANVLKEMGVEKGDRVIIYLPMIPEVTIAMLACSRIGAVHSVVFAGFSPDSLAARIQDCEPKLVITSSYGYRGGKTIPLKQNVNEALQKSTTLPVIVVNHSKNGDPVPLISSQDYGYEDLMAGASQDCPVTPMGAEDPFFILYTSGSTGKPKGLLHTTGGYLVYAAMTFDHIFNYQTGEIFWCTADAGWITGHTYGVYGPLAKGATTVMFEGIPTYPTFERYWQIVDKYKVNLFYTAPTAIRSLIQAGNEHLTSSRRDSLRVLGTVGEPIDPTSWQWYFDVVGKGQCPIVDTWWQTETGGIMITPLAGITPLKPGSATLPFYGVKPEIVDEAGQVLTGSASGNLVIGDSWPGQARTIYGDPQRFFETYFAAYPGQFATGDMVLRDPEGYYWISGRSDDVIKVSGHRLGTAELESALEAHPAVVEAAVVGFPHEVKGQGLYAYVVLSKGSVGQKEQLEQERLEKELIQWVRDRIGPIATFDYMQFTRGVPKTRSGKVMRRILRKIASNDLGEKGETLGDISTLLDPEIVDYLIEHRRV
jgi:acetyl-CoA synthetase